MLYNNIIWIKIIVTGTLLYSNVFKYCFALEKNVSTNIIKLTHTFDFWQSGKINKITLMNSIKVFL